MSDIIKVKTEATAAVNRQANELPIRQTHLERNAAAWAAQTKLAEPERLYGTFARMIHSS